MKKIKKFGSGSWEMKKTGHERKGESYILKTEESTEGIFWENTGVAYVYEYRKGKKEENCGFVKVESWGERCTMELHLQCPGILAGTECKSYAFVRAEKKMRGILLDSCKTEANGVRHILETSPRNIGGQRVALEEIGGMVFLTELGAFFGTEWDDIEIIPELFEEFSEEDSPEEEQEEPPTEEENVTATEVQQERHMPGEPYTPFEDGDFFNCRKIKPGDLPCFSGKNCPLRQNRFLLYGYYNFGHLLLCTKENGQQILGVPGIYDQQERFMANMFGFPFFRKSREIQVPGRQGGYWYRLINSPDFHQGDEFQKNGTKVQ